MKIQEGPCILILLILKIEFASIPAFRLVAGFADPTAATRLVLTDRDVRGQVNKDELVRAARLTETIVRSALVADADEVAKWRRV
ncbi:MAG: hypothetical protein QF474_07790 [SAR324 cluster bacterium]|jgi:hypothetical protein|nr:hypothetical protein [SAR324 cluster bacterium]